jgi:DNA-binding response OmpR family regulator
MDKIKVLIADDISSFRKFIDYAISQNYPNVETEMATNGLDAKKKLELNQYDLVLCDWGMPQMPGIELLKWLRNHPTLNKMPFVMITANSDKEAVITATKLGATSYILKPISIDQLIARLATIFSRFNM